MSAERRAELVSVLRRLVACPSVSGEPSTIADVLAEEFASLRAEVVTVPVAPSTAAGSPEYSPPTSVRGPQPPAFLAAFAGEGPELLLFAHTDTEPVHAGWRTDPFRLEIEGARATGLGVADDKGGVIAVLTAVRQWQERGQTGWRPRVLLAAGKQGGSLGTLPGVQAASGVRAALYSHPAESGAGLTQLKVASRGIVTCRIQVPGSTPQPVEERTPVSADPTAGRNAAERAARLAAAVAEWRDEARVWSVTALRAGGVSYEVPGRAGIDVSCWFSDGTVQDVVRTVRSRAAGGDDDWEREHPPTVEAVGVRANPATCADAPFARSVADAVAARTGHRPSEYSWHSASDIRFPMRVLGIPAVGLGARGGGFYGPGEWVDLDSLDVSARVLADVLCAGPA